MAMVVIGSTFGDNGGHSGARHSAYDPRCHHRRAARRSALHEHKEIRQRQCRRPCRWTKRLGCIALRHQPRHGSPGGCRHGDRVMPATVVLLETGKGCYRRSRPSPDLWDYNHYAVACQQAWQPTRRMTKPVSSSAAAHSFIIFYKIITLQTGRLVEGADAARRLRRTTLWQPTVAPAARQLPRTMLGLYQDRARKCRAAARRRANYHRTPRQLGGVDLYSMPGGAMVEQNCFRSHSPLTLPVNTSNIMHLVTLIPSAKLQATTKDRSATRSGRNIGALSRCAA